MSSSSSGHKRARDDDASASADDDAAASSVPQPPAAKRSRRSEQPLASVDPQAPAPAAHVDDEKKAEGAAVPAAVAPLNRRLAINTILSYGIAGPCTLGLTWQCGVEFVRKQVRGLAAEFAAYLERAAPTIAINAVGQDGICGAASIAILFAPSSTEVMRALGADLAAHRLAVQELLHKYRHKFEEVNIPLGIARIDPGGTWIVCDPGLSQQWMQSAKDRKMFQLVPDA